MSMDALTLQHSRPTCRSARALSPGLLSLHACIRGVLSVRIADVVKTRLQLQRKSSAPQYRGTLDTLKQIMQQERYVHCMLM